MKCRRICSCVIAMVLLLTTMVWEAPSFAAADDYEITYQTSDFSDSTKLPENWTVTEGRLGNGPTGIHIEDSKLKYTHSSDEATKYSGTMAAKFDLPKPIPLGKGLGEAVIEASVYSKLTAELPTDSPAGTLSRNKFITFLDASGETLLELTLMYPGGWIWCASKEYNNTLKRPTQTTSGGGYIRYDPAETIDWKFIIDSDNSTISAMVKEGNAKQEGEGSEKVITGDDTYVSAYGPGSETAFKFLVDNATEVAAIQFKMDGSGVSSEDEIAISNFSYPVISFSDKPDTQAPVWQDGAELTASDITGSGMTLRWPAAEDNFEVAGYKIYNDDTELADAGNTLSYALNGLTGDTEYRLCVKAYDAAGNLSEPLEKTVRTIPNDNPSDAGSLEHLYRDAYGYVNMEYDGDKWIGGGAQMKEGALTPADGADAVWAWRSDRMGTVTMTGKPVLTGGSADIIVKKNTEVLWSGSDLTAGADIAPAIAGVAVNPFDAIYVIVVKKSGDPVVTWVPDITVTGDNPVQANAGVQIADDGAAVTVQAESGELQGVETATAVADYQGAGYVTGFDNEGDALTWRLFIPNSGNHYNLGFRYHAAAAAGGSLYVNGKKLTALSFAQADGWQQSAETVAVLRYGTNIVTLKKDSADAGGMDIDSLTCQEETGYAWDKEKDTTANIEHVSLFSPSMNRQVGFNVFLPPSYDADRANRYPVIYNLHSLGSSARAYWTMINNYRPLMESGDVNDAIWVFVEGRYNTFYHDAYDGTSKSETSIIDEIIPYVDRNYRTIANRDARGIMGFSMGGHGSIKLMSKYPELFRTAVTYGGAFHTTDTFKGQYASYFAELFNNDAALMLPQVEAETATHHDQDIIGRNAAQIKALGVNIMMVCGTGDHTLGHNQRLDQRLTAEGIDHTYTEIQDKSYTHDPDKYMQSSYGAAGYRYLSENLTDPVIADITPAGSLSAKATFPGSKTPSWDNLVQTIPAENNTDYVVTAKLKKVSGNGTIVMRLIADNTQVVITRITPTDDWSKYKLTYHNDNAKKLSLYFSDSSETPVEVLIDDCFISTSEDGANLLTNGDFEQGKESWDFGGEFSIYKAVKPRLIYKTETFSAKPQEGWSYTGSAESVDGRLTLSGAGNTSATYTLHSPIPFGDPEIGVVEFETTITTGQTEETGEAGRKEKVVSFLDSAGAEIVQFQIAADGWLFCKVGDDVQHGMKVEYKDQKATAGENVSVKLQIDTIAKTASIWIKNGTAVYAMPTYYLSSNGSSDNKYENMPLSQSTADIAAVKYSFYGNSSGTVNSMTVDNFRYPYLASEDDVVLEHAEEAFWCMPISGWTMQNAVIEQGKLVLRAVGESSAVYNLGEPLTLGADDMGTVEFETAFTVGQVNAADTDNGVKDKEFWLLDADGNRIVSVSVNPQGTLFFTDATTSRTMKINYQDQKIAENQTVKVKLAVNVKKKTLTAMLDMGDGYVIPTYYWPESQGGDNASDHKYENLPLTAEKIGGVKYFFYGNEKEMTNSMMVDSLRYPYCPAQDTIGLVSSLALTQDGAPITALTKAGTIAAEAEVYNHASTQGKVVMAIALYQNGEMTNVVYQTVLCPADQRTAARAELTIDQADDNTQVKAFVLNEQNLQPYSGRIAIGKAGLQ